MARTRVSIPLVLLLFLLYEELFILIEMAVDANDAPNVRHLVVAFTKTVHGYKMQVLFRVILNLILIVHQFSAQVQIIRDSNGFITDVSGVGPLMLSWLSLEYNFTYYFLLFYLKCNWLTAALKIGYSWSILQTKEDLIV